MSLKTLIKYIVTITAYAYLGYKLYTFDQYAEIANHFHRAGLLEWVYFSLILLLLPLNLFIESKKWQELVKCVTPYSIKDAIISVFQGQGGGFITPNRLGEFPMRTLSLAPQHRLSATALGLWGGFSTTIAVLISGLLALPFYYHTNIILSTTTYIGIVAAIAIYFFIPKLSSSSLLYQHPKIALILKHLDNKTNTVTLLLSFARQIVFGSQLYLGFRFFGINLGLYDSIITIPLFYLFITVTPTINISAATVRGAFAFTLFTAIGANGAAAAIASIVIWTINNITPLIISTAIRKKKQ